jgi:biotin/methionine sulfoxide reductase
VVRTFSHASHWGSYSVEVVDGQVTAVTPHPEDTDPSPLLANVAGTVRSPARVLHPTVRRGWWDDGAGPDHRRGADEWLEVSWEVVSDRLAAELRRVIDHHGHQAIYAGSYGWASAGRFHHAQSQLRRFTGLLGGATVSIGSYSTGAAERILPHVLGSAEELWQGATAWPVIAEHTEMMVAFGGLPAKNSFVSPGGLTRHTVSSYLRQAVGRGMRIVVFSPLRDDVAAELGARWHALRPGTDVAVMLALAHVLVRDGLADLEFCDRYCVGTDRLISYILGEDDGVAKTPRWAAALSEVPADSIETLAREMAARRTMLTSSWSLQRTRHGEQPVWMSIALAALLGQIGRAGGGFGHGYGSLADIGGGRDQVPFPALPGAVRSLQSWIPVARVADMLLDPGSRYEVDGQRRIYPDIRLVYWSGGNPFHHHQDINRLRRALRRPDTVVVNEPYWTPMARHADVVLPATITLERNDVATGRGDGRVVAMQQAVEPAGEARNDHDIFAGLADRLGFGPAFREGRDERAWLEWLWNRFRGRLAAAGLDSPDFERFWADGEMVVPGADDDRVLFSDFRRDPVAHPLRTPSGRIELHSEVIAGYGYDDCPPHPAWLAPDEWLGAPMAARWPLHLIANNPATRLHSQLDPGSLSRGSKVAGREPIRMHPDDAAARGLVDGDVVKVHNDRGACLAGLVTTDAVRPGVVQLSTGAWYDPDDPTAAEPTCRHGNPNVLTADVGSSRLAQGCTGQHCLVEVSAIEGVAPRVQAWDPPVIGGT